MFKFIFSGQLFSLLLLFSCAASNADEKMYAGVDRSFPNSSIQELKSSKKSGNYNVKAFVVFIYKCPACPKGAKCKACMQDNIVISEINRPLSGYYLNSTELIVYTYNSTNFREFKIGSYAEFSVELDKRADKDGGSAKLLGYNIIDN